MTALPIAVATVLGIGLLVVLHGTIFKTTWGINPASSFECPRCHATQSALRAPRNKRQVLWGGYTCQHCGIEVDKWNRPLSKA